jgi:hypothetical protein
MEERLVMGSSSARLTILTAVFPHIIWYKLSHVELRDSDVSIIYRALDGFGDLLMDAI